MIDLQFHYQQKWLIILANNDCLVLHEQMTTFIYFHKSEEEKQQIEGRSGKYMSY